MQSLHLADDELSCIDLGFTEVTGAGEETDEVSGYEESVLSEWAPLVGDGLGGCVVDLVPPSTQLPSSQSPPLSQAPPLLLPPTLNAPAPSPPSPSPPDADPLCIHHRLRDLYSQRLSEPFPFPNKHVKPTSFLLKRLLKENSFNMVVIKLYPLDKGYTISLRSVNGKEFQESVQPYSQNLLLDYINNEELPPVFLDYWETTFPQIFYTGCVLVEVKDGRICDPPIISHVLLKPTTQTLVNDVTTLLLGEASSSSCSSDLRLALEGSIINNVQQPLSLNPSSEVGRRRCNRHHLRRAMLTRALASKTSFQSETRNHLELKVQDNRRKRSHLFEFTSKKRVNSIPPKSDILPQPPPKVTLTNTSWNGSVDAVCNVSTFARPIARPPGTDVPDWSPDTPGTTPDAPDVIPSSSPDNTPEIVAQYILETDCYPLNTTYPTRLTLLQRPTNFEYLGTLYIDKDYKEGLDKGCVCRFTLGSRATANRYINQFAELFIGEYKKSARITLLEPGKPARVIYGENKPVLMEREGKLAAAANLRVHNHSKTVMQVNKNTIHNPAISALANNFLRNSVHQYQQQAAVAAAATPNASVAPHRDASGIVGNTMGNVVESVNVNIAGVPGIGIQGVGVYASATRHPLQPTNANAIVLSLHNKTGVATQTTTFHQQQLTQQGAPFQQQHTQVHAQHKVVGRKMTISNLVGTRFRPTNTTTASQLTPHQTEVQVRPDVQPLQQTISVQAYGPHFHPLSGVNLKGLKVSSAGVRGFVSSSASSQAVQALHMLSASKEAVVSQQGQQANQVASSLSLSLPGLSALLADIEDDV